MVLSKVWPKLIETGCSVLTIDSVLLELSTLVISQGVRFLLLESEDFRLRNKVSMIPRHKQDPSHPEQST